MCAFVACGLRWRYSGGRGGDVVSGRRFNWHVDKCNDNIFQARTATFRLALVVDVVDIVFNSSITRIVTLFCGCFGRYSVVSHNGFFWCG